ncbi:hypothetical protein KFE25_012366 [Diacronema lutheri]|uniref:Uncharacterized protein n=1 Tax=Diacronema lutheri TaxID=2081491 RepID=A0A8J5XDU4_DIALT|nr:hypothetical protein KFE25_012366 [Diacronema lutheri]
MAAQLRLLHGGKSAAESEHAPLGANATPTSAAPAACFARAASASVQPGHGSHAGPAANVGAGVGTCAARPPLLQSAERVLDEWTRLFLDAPSAQTHKPPPPMPPFVRAAVLAAASERRSQDDIGEHADAVTQGAHGGCAMARAPLDDGVSSRTLNAHELTADAAARGAALSNWVQYLENDDCALSQKPAPARPPLVALERAVRLVRNGQ